MKASLRDVKDQVFYCERSIAKMQTAVTQNDMRDAWENYLMRFSRAVGKLISISRACPDGREFSGRLKDASTKSDPGLVYLREARNADDHGVEQPAAEYEDPAISIFGNSIHLVGDVGTINSRFIINGVDHGLISAGLVDGKAKIKSDKPLEHSIVPSKLVLQDAHNPEKKIVVPPPHSVFGGAVENGDALELAEKSLKGLKLKLAEFEKLL